MKKITALLFALILLLVFTACGGDTADASVSPTPLPEWAMMVQDFEAWTADFLEVSEKVVANPKDIDAYNKMMEMTQEAYDWDKKVADMEASLAQQPEELAAFVNEINRVVQIMNDYAAGIEATPAP